MMLKGLFNKLKSQKSSTLKNDEFHEVQNHNSKNNFFQLYSLLTPQDEYKLANYLSSQSQILQSFVENQIKQVRYWTNTQIPNIFTKVLSCPISYFNLLPHSKRKVKQIDLKKDKFPDYLSFMKSLLQKQLPTYNHILINHYPKGIGIMPHFDGPMYKDKVIVLSLGGPSLISFQQNYSKQSQNMKILLQDKSIHIFEQDAYKKCLHGIQDNKIDCLTFEILKKVQGDKSQNNNLIKLKSLNNEDKVEYLIGQSSIMNMNGVKSVKQVIEKYLNRLIFEQIQIQQQKYCFEFDQFKGYGKIKGCFIFINEMEIQNIKQNDKQLLQKNKYKWKMQIQRQQRISITIRQQFLPQSFL